MNPERERYLKHTQEYDAAYDKHVTQAIAATEFQLHLRRKETEWLYIQSRNLVRVHYYYSDPEELELVYPHAEVMGLHHLFN